MTTELKPGLRWARKTKDPITHKYGSWCIVELEGHAPLMTAEVFYTTKENPSDYDYEDITDPNQYQWGPEIEIPAQNWVEINAEED